MQMLLILRSFINPKVVKIARPIIISTGKRYCHNPENSKMEKLYSPCKPIARINPSGRKIFLLGKQK